MNSTMIAQAVPYIETSTGFSSTANATISGYWLRIARALEFTAGVSNTAAPTTAGYMLRAAIALETKIARTPPTTYSTTETGLLARLVDDLESAVGVGSGSLEKRFRDAAMLWSPSHATKFGTVSETITAVDSFASTASFPNTLSASVAAADSYSSSVIGSLTSPTITKTSAAGANPMAWDGSYPGLTIDDVIHLGWTRNGVAGAGDTHTVTSGDLLLASEGNYSVPWTAFQSASGGFVAGDVIVVWEWITRGGSSSANSNTLTDTVSGGANFQATASAINTSLGYTSATHTFTGISFPAGRPVIMIATSDGRTITALTVNGHALTDLGDNNLWISSTVEAGGSYDIAVTMDNGIGSVSIWPGAISGITSSTPVGTSRLSYGFQSAGAHTGTSTITLSAGQLGIMFGLGISPSAYVPSGASVVRDYGTGTFWLDSSLDAFWTKFTVTGAPGFTTGSGGNKYLTAAGFG